jgi:hypothetical protein
MVMMDNRLIEDFCNYYGIINLKVDEQTHMRLDPYYQIGNKVGTAQSMYQYPTREQTVTMTLPRRSLDRMVEIEYYRYEEQELRRRNPSAAKAYEHYKMILDLVR